MKSASTLVTLFLLGLLCTACAPSEGPASAGAEATPDTDMSAIPPEALERARSAASALGGQLMNTLLRELSDGGPVQAVKVCSEVAPSIAETHSREGLDVGRVSLKLRNPANAPDAYEEEKLEELASLLAADRLPKEIVEVVEAEGHRELRYLRPIKVMTPCLKCHGPQEGIDPQVLALLDQRYPQDRARGYSAGDLRGAISVRVEL